MKQRPLPYSLDPEPAHASLAAHAATFSAYCYEVTDRTLEKLPIPMPVIAGKRQPRPHDVFAALLARIEDEHTRNVCVVGLPQAFAGSIWAALPKALEIRAEELEAQRRKRTAA